MDLLATVRKEGSRGGRGDFKWSDVENSSHRQNYLGHSLMAPVGRWQKGRDLSWYAKNESGDGSAEDAAEKAARERREEIRRVKEAEEDALARALGLPVAPRTNANEEPLGNRKEVDKLLRDATDGNEAAEGKGIGYGSRTGVPSLGPTSERIEGNAEQQDKELQCALKEYRRRHEETMTKEGSRDKTGVTTTIIDIAIGQQLLTGNRGIDHDLIRDRGQEVPNGRDRTNLGAVLGRDPQTWTDGAINLTMINVIAGGTGIDNLDFL